MKCTTSQVTTKSTWVCLHKVNWVYCGPGLISGPEIRTRPENPTRNPNFGSGSGRLKKFRVSGGSGKVCFRDPKKTRKPEYCVQWVQLVVVPKLKWCALPANNNNFEINVSNFRRLCNFIQICNFRQNLKFAPNLNYAPKLKNSGFRAGFEFDHSGFGSSLNFGFRVGSGSGFVEKISGRVRVKNQTRCQAWPVNRYKSAVK